MIKLSLSVDGIWECFHTLALKGCLVFEVEQISCNTYRVHNRSFAALPISVQEMQSDKSFLEVGTDTVEELSFTDIKLTRDGIYQLVLTGGFLGNDIIFSIANFCNIRQCIHQHITGLICEAPKNDCKEDDHYDFNALMTVYRTFLSLIDKKFVGDLALVEYPSDTLDDLFEFKEYIDKMQEYCESCDIACEKCSNDPSKSFCSCP